MGFRSTLVTQDNGITWPEWFVTKYSPFLNISGCLSSKAEKKTYGVLSELDADIQKAIDWDEYPLGSLVLVYLHECGGITRVQIEKDAIKYSEPELWAKRMTSSIGIALDAQTLQPLCLQQPDRLIAL